MRENLSILGKGEGDNFAVRCAVTLINTQIDPPKGLESVPIVVKSFSRHAHNKDSAVVSVLEKLVKIGEISEDFVRWQLALRRGNVGYATKLN